jgi:hypothetical protein
MSEPKEPVRRSDTCLRACLDAMDYCVDSAGPSTFAVGCYQDYSECTDHCDSLVRPEGNEVG